MIKIILTKQIVCSKSNEILETDCDMASLYILITKIPTKIEDIEAYEVLIKKAISLYTQFPPETLPKLNEKWTDKWYVSTFLLHLHFIKFQMFGNSSKIQTEQMAMRENEISLRQRRIRKKIEDDFDSKIITRRKNDTKKTRNKFIMGFLTIGMAATAAYVFTTNPKEPEDIFMKFLHLLSYK